MKTFLLSRTYPLPRMTGTLIMKISSSLSILMVWEGFLFFSPPPLSLFFLLFFLLWEILSSQRAACRCLNRFPPPSSLDLYVRNHVSSAVDLQVWWSTCSGLHSRTLHTEQTFNRWRDSEVRTHRSQIQTQMRFGTERKISGTINTQSISIVLFDEEHSLL